MTLTIIAIYVTGMIVNYIFLRWLKSDNWTVKEKTKTIMLSFLSWLCIIMTLIFALLIFIIERLNDNTKAKW